MPVARRLAVLGLAGVACWLVLATAGRVRVQASSPQQPSPAPAPGHSPAPSAERALLQKYCVGCHNETARRGGLALEAPLEAMDTAGNLGGRADVWEKVVRKLRADAMPPAGLPRPDAPARAALVSWLEAGLDRAAALHPNPGRTESLHRLNRAEYQNAIRDLLGLDLNLDAGVASLLPPDAADTRGFDNMATLLSVSPGLLERYLAAAAKLSRLALGLPPSGPRTDTYKLSSFDAQDRQASEDLPFGSRGGIAIRHYFPVDGDYVIKVNLRRSLYDYIVGLGQPQQLDVRLDGERVKSFIVGGETHSGRAAPATFGGEILGDPAWEKYALHADDDLQARVHVKAGPRVVGVSYVARFSEPEEVRQPMPERGLTVRNENPEGNQLVNVVAISGPESVSGASPADTPSRRQIVVCQPTSATDEEACAGRILTRLARRAYRRPITETESQTMLGFFRTGRRDSRSGGGFDAGLQLAIQRILVDPIFLFRVERDPAGAASSTVYAVSDIELASRLSFFLWSSVPDDELLKVAESGRLKDPVQFERQARRLLADPRSRALVDNFVGQWLLLRNLRNATPDLSLFPDFDERLREAFQRETEMFVGSQFREDRSVVDLLRADYTFVNERLAKHYDIPNVHGDTFRRVTFSPDNPRGGLLGQGSLLTVTSYPNRTSPVLRGKWVLDSLLGTPPPAPPPNVPSLKDRGEDGKPASVRERLEAHRKNPVCATCHSQMDPLGFALENFDATGRWRTRDAGAPIDASGTLPNGAPLQGPSGLRSVLLGRRDQFVGAMTEKLFAYALGRQVEYYDLPAVRKIVRESTARDYRWSSIVLGIVKSPQFQMRITRGQEP